MRTEKITLAGSQETLLFTLYFRVLDAQSRAPLVGDSRATDVLSRIDYDHRKLKRKAGDRFLSLLRAKRLDGWTRAFLAAHPDATVLHLGCGLDSRAFRLDVPDGVRWVDLDYPQVINLRKRLYPEADGYQMIASSVTDMEWLDESTRTVLSW